MAMKRAMIVDDAVFMRTLLKDMLSQKGYEVVAEAASGIDAMKKLKESSPDLILLDVILPDMNGLDLIDSILSEHPGTHIVVCSSLGHEAVLSKARELGAVSYIQKPLRPERLAEVLSQLEA